MGKCDPMLKWSLQYQDKMSSVPQPRLCHIKKWTHFDGYGFNLHGDKNKPGQLIGKIDEGSPALAGGLKLGDRIIEVDGVNVLGQTHNEVVERIKVSGGGNEVRLLVADRACEAYHDDEEIDIDSSLEYVLCLSSETSNLNSYSRRRESSTESDSDEGLPQPRLRSSLKQRQDISEKFEINVNMSAKEMRRRVGSLKKKDPRKDEKIGFKEKCKIVDNL